MSDRIKNLEKAKADKQAAAPLHLKFLNPTIMGNASRLAHVTSGPVGQDSRGYSIARAAGVAMGIVAPENAKEEAETNVRLKGIYNDYRRNFSPGSFLVPMSADMVENAIDPQDDKGHKFTSDLRQKMAGSLPSEGEVDLDFVAHYRRKTLSTLASTSGGSTVAPPVLGDLIDIQRNGEVFSRCGARNIGLPPNGQIRFPKLTGTVSVAATSELGTIGSSEETFADLLLVAKKYAITVPMSAELIQYSNKDIEAIVRNDVAQQSVRVTDGDMLTGTGGAKMLGLLNYANITSHTASAPDTNGDTFMPEDIALMEGKLPDAVEAPTAWVMRRLMAAYLANRRNDAVSANDERGAFTLNPFRIGSEGPYQTLANTKIVRSNTVANNRVKGTGTNLTYILLGYFPDWIIARMGAMEFLPNPYGNGFSGDYVELRCKQYMDAGARHPESFVLCDQLLLA